MVNEGEGIGEKILKRRKLYNLCPRGAVARVEVFIKRGARADRLKRVVVPFGFSEFCICRRGRSLFMGAITSSRITIGSLEKSRCITSDPGGEKRISATGTAILMRGLAN